MYAFVRHGSRAIQLDLKVDNIRIKQPLKCFSSPLGYKVLLGHLGRGEINSESAHQHLGGGENSSENRGVRSHYKNI